jgi:SAM-dependent methyltransferase
VPSAAGDGYGILAAIYDEWQEEFGPFWRLCEPRLRATLDRHPPPAPVDLIDLGCGTGALLLDLRRRHPDWTLTGLDASAGMIEAARGKPGAGSIEWVHADFDQVRGPHGVAVSFFDALNHAAGPGELSRALAAISAALVPGGLFIFDVNNGTGFRAWWHGRRDYRTSRWTLTMEATFDERSGLARGLATVVRRGGAPLLIEVTERALEEDEVRATLEGSGLHVEVCEPWRPLPRDVPGKTWWVARKG